MEQTRGKKDEGAKGRQLDKLVFNLPQRKITTKNNGSIHERMKGLEEDKPETMKKLES